MLDIDSLSIQELRMITQRKRDVELFKEKQAFLSDRYKKVEPLDYFRALFPIGSFERQGEPADERPNAILTSFQKESREDGSARLYGTNCIVFDELEGIKEHLGDEFVILAPVSYYGRKKDSKRSAFLYAMIFDIDGVEQQQLRDLFYQMKNGLLPTCSFCINSGHGVHVVYQFREPVKLTPKTRKSLKQLKHDLTELLWNPYTSLIKERQYQGIYQGFRMPGTQTKLGQDYLVEAYRVGEPIDVEEFNDFLVRDEHIKDLAFKSDLTKSEAKALYPEWYEKRIIQGKPKDHYTTNRGLYDWWLRLISRGGVTCGHRYNCMVVLAAFAKKSGVDFDELKEAAYALVDRFDILTDNESNHFVKQDADDALKLYWNDESYRLTRKEAERLSGIPIPATKRYPKGSPQRLSRTENMKSRAIRERDLIYADGAWRNKKGRPTAEATVKKWKSDNPGGSKNACIKETGLSKHTVYKWWA